MIQAQEVLDVTERAVFRHIGGELRLEEIAPGIDLEAHILGRMAFQPAIADALEPMPQAWFEP